MSAAHRSMMVMLNNTDLLWYAGLAAAACVGVVIGVLITVAIVLCDRKCFRKRKDGAKESYEQFVPRETLRIDSQILEPWREIAEILGVSLNEYVEEYIRFRSDEIQNGGLPLIAAEVEHKAYRRREQAEAIAERFEAFAIEKQLEGRRANLGTIASRIEPTPDGYWTIKTDYLSPNVNAGGRSQFMRMTNGKPRRHDFDRPRGGTAGNSALSFWDHAHTEFC